MGGAVFGPRDRRDQGTLMRPLLYVLAAVAALTTLAVPAAYAAAPQDCIYTELGRNCPV
jgi:hypothetical protein